MIVKEQIVIREKPFNKTYSDSGFMIKQKETGLIYTEAVDILEANYTYEETEIPIAQNEEDI